MPRYKMSAEEQRVQHETISAIDSKVSGIDDKVTEFTKTAVKVGKIWIPVFGAVCTAIGALITLTITGYKWEDSLIKKPQFEHVVSALMRQDSILHAKIDTTNTRIDKLPKLRLTKVISRNGKFIEVD
jgi:hypothetical protein